MNDQNNAPNLRRRGSRRWNGEALHAAFAAAASTRPWTAGYQSFEEDRVMGVAQCWGELPPGLRGTLYRNGPARHERGGKRYAHQWDGDGMIQQFRLGDGTVSHVGQYVHTPKYLEESRLGHFVHNVFGTQVSPERGRPACMDDVNPSNISVLAHGGELLALWEAGSAFRLDPDTLATQGPKVWSPLTGGRSFSAHPKVEADGSMWNFGANVVASELTIYHVGADGSLLSCRNIQVDRLPPVHDFTVTARHLVFLLPSFDFNKDRLLDGAPFAEACQWAPTTPMRALLIDKVDGSQRWYELPAGCMFHVANAWEDAQGVVRVQYMRAATPMSLLAGWMVMRGEYVHSEGARLTSLVLRPDSAAGEQASIVEADSEFPSIDDGMAGRRSERVLCLERSAQRRPDVPGFDQIALVDVETGAAQRFNYGDNWLVEEHLFVGEQGASTATWIIGTALDLSIRSTVLSVFEAGSLSAGPIFEATLPYGLPIGLHGRFVAEAP